MNLIRIAHISDPHFGAHQRQPEIWNAVCDYLNEIVRPHLVLVTGDIVHTPNPDLYREARRGLDKLKVIGRSSSNEPIDSFRVCAGNHDRHPYGNAPGGGVFEWVFEKWAGWNANPAGLDNEFTGLIPTVRNPHNFKLSQGENSWDVRVIGFDTSAHVDFTALGFAPQVDLKGLGKAASADPNPDLVILMHHHHLLSIAELEERRRSQGALRRILQPTIMLNAGAVLEALAQGSVNLVLHGHEHCRMFARYGTLRGEQNDTVVVGAGSVTGNDSVLGC